MKYRTKGTCSSSIDIEMDGNVIKSVIFTGGCNGNLQGISKLVEGMSAEDAISPPERNKMRFQAHFLPGSAGNRFGIHCGKG